jgi:hypothetical protein
VATAVGWTSGPGVIAGIGIGAVTGVVIESGIEDSIRHKLSPEC